MSHERRSPNAATGTAGRAFAGYPKQPSPAIAGALISAMARLSAACRGSGMTAPRPAVTARRQDLTTAARRQRSAWQGHRDRMPVGEALTVGVAGPGQQIAFALGFGGPGSFGSPPADNAVFGAVVDGLRPPGQFVDRSRPCMAASGVFNVRRRQMPKPRAFPALSLFAAATAGRNMTRTAYIAVLSGVAMMVLLTVDPAYEVAHHWVDAVLWACLAYFMFEWVVRLRHAFQAHRGWTYALSGRGLLDAISAAGIPLALIFGANPKSAWLLGIVWMFKVVPGIPGLRQLRRVLVLESGPLLSVLVIFLMVLFLASVAVYYLERDAQPAAFGSVPAALWWAVATLTTTGYGDVVPVTPLGRLVAAFVMICGLGVFGLWAGILATGFAAETRRDNFLKTWESVTKVPFFAALGPAAIADVTHMLRTMDLPARAMIIRKGQAGDCMYFIANGEVEVDLPGNKVRLGEGAFFGEMALLGNNLRSANITTTQVSKLLVLDLVDFRMLMARHPDLAETIDAEAKRRAMENK
jgi:voltage-gated potassium channel